MWWCHVRLGESASVQECSFGVKYHECRFRCSSADYAPYVCLRWCSCDVVFGAWNLSYQAISCHHLFGDFFASIVDVRVALLSSSHTSRLQTMSSSPSGSSGRVLLVFVRISASLTSLLHEAPPAIVDSFGLPARSSGIAATSSWRVPLDTLVAASSGSTLLRVCLGNFSLLDVFIEPFRACRVPPHLVGDPRSTVFDMWLSDFKAALTTQCLVVVGPSSHHCLPLEVVWLQDSFPPRNAWRVKRFFFVLPLDATRCRFVAHDVFHCARVESEATTVQPLHDELQLWSRGLVWFEECLLSERSDLLLERLVRRHAVASNMEGRQCPCCMSYVSKTVLSMPSH